MINVKVKKLTFEVLIQYQTLDLSIAFAGGWVQLNGIAFDVETARTLLALDPVDADDRLLEEIWPDDLVGTAVRPHSHVFPQI